MQLVYFRDAQPVADFSTGSKSWRSGQRVSRPGHVPDRTSAHEHPDDGIGVRPFRGEHAKTQDPVCGDRADRRLQPSGGRYLPMGIGLTVAAVGINAGRHLPLCPASQSGVTCFGVE